MTFTPLNEFIVDQSTIRCYVDGVINSDYVDSNRVFEMLALAERWKPFADQYSLLERDIRNLNNHLKLKKIYQPSNQDPELNDLESPIISYDVRSESSSLIPPSLIPSTTSLSSAMSLLLATSLHSARLSKPITYSSHITPLISTSSFKPTSESITQFYQAQGIVGEETTGEILLYGALAKTNMGIESLAGSGKSVLLYALLEAIPKEKYNIIHQATGKSLYQDVENNKVDFWIIPELQKIFTRDIEEIIKNLTEGISTTYTRTNSKKDGVDKFEIKKKAVLYSFAITNKYTKEKDDELARRFIILHTDISKKQNREVALRYAQKQFSQSNEVNLNDFKRHIAECLDSEVEVKNPFLPYLVGALPQQITGHVRFRSSVKYIQDLVKGATLFHADDVKDPLFSTVDHVSHILNLYSKTLVDNLYGLSVVDRAVLDLITTNESGSVEEIQEIFNDQYVARSIQESIKKLSSSSLLTFEEGKGSLQAKNLTINFNHEEAFGAADQLMKAYFNSQRDQWREKHGY